MHKIKKSKSGFTLLEMILVVAIIIMLAAVVTFNAVDIYKKSKAGSESVSDARTSLDSGMAASERALRDNYNF